ncbi:MAG: hypothetical protein GXX96_06820 [Planctomycetaceae bacterium]|nr:hypothetical protein [Planctomycetaceae bacterium]
MPRRRRCGRGFWFVNAPDYASSWIAGRGQEEIRTGVREAARHSSVGMTR